MIRKQLYIGEDQERILKRRAAELGTSEAELVRWALDLYLREAPTRRVRSPGQREALERWRSSRERLAEKLSFPPDWRFRREEVYAEREARPSRS